jgi:Protein of unknown function (DUF1360)
MKNVRETPTEPVDYAAISAGYGALLGALVLAAREREDAVPMEAVEIVPLGAAAFALSKLIAKEKVESWVREPFVEEIPSGERRPKGRRLRYAVGELLTCTRCVGAWSALGLVGLRTVRPREGRVVTTVLAVSAANDFLHTAFQWLCDEANATRKRAAGAAVTEETPRTRPPRAAARERGGA